MKRLLIMIGMVLLLTLPLTAFAENSNVRFESKAEVDVQEVDEQGNKTWVRQPAKLVVPGTIVIYTNTFTNQGAEAAEGLVVTNPIPENMVYFPASAIGDKTDITFSVDAGENFASEDALTMIGADGRPRPAEPKDITHIRWLVTAPLQSGETGQVEYRARLL